MSRGGGGAFQSFCEEALASYRFDGMNGHRQQGVEAFYSALRVYSLSYSYPMGFLLGSIASIIPMYLASFYKPTLRVTIYDFWITV